MAIGDDIKGVLSELGTPYTIYKIDGSIITGEFMDYEHNYAHSTDFIRQNVYTADLPHDTQVYHGDILNLSGLWVLVLNFKTLKFENAPVINNCFLVETNCLGHFARPVKVRSNMENTVTWEAVRSNVRALQLEFIRNPSYPVMPEVEFPAVREILYVPKFPEIQIGDRWYPNSTDTTKYLRVMNLQDHTFEGVYRLNLDDDTRE